MEIIPKLFSKFAFMKKIIFLSTILIGFLGAKAQEYHHSYGLGGIYAMNTYTFVETNTGLHEFGGGVNAVAGGFYKAVFAFDVNNGDNFALSTAPLSGLNLSGSYGAFGFDIPLYAEYYFGGIDDLCLYIQAGFSYTYISEANYYSSIIGPRFGIGAHFRLDTISYIVSLSLGYGLNNKGNQPSSVERTQDTRSLLNFSVGYLLDY
jgi:hypothetical protein